MTRRLRARFGETLSVRLEDRVIRVTGQLSNWEDIVSACSMVHKKDVFTPDMEQYKIYKELYHEVFKNIYGCLSGLYSRLHEIYHRK